MGEGGFAEFGKLDSMKIAGGCNSLAALSFKAAPLLPILSAFFHAAPIFKAAPLGQAGSAPTARYIRAAQDEDFNTLPGWQKMDQT